DRRARISMSQLIRKNPLVLVLVYIAYARGLVPVIVLHTLIYYLIVNELLVAYLTRKARAQRDRSPVQDTRILLPVANPETMIPLLSLAGHLGSGDAPAKIYPLNIVADTEDAMQRIRHVENQFKELKNLYATRDEDLELTARIENDRIYALTHAAR